MNTQTRTKQPRRGFSLLELVIVTALLSVISLLGLVAIQAATNSAALADTVAVTQDDVRQLMTLMTEELQLAAKEEDDSLIPPLEAMTIREPGGEIPIEIEFQRPVDGTGSVWSNPIIYRFVNEDANENGILDTGEDLDDDGILERMIMRIEDINGDGDTADPGEARQLGTARNLTNVEFELNDGLLTIRLESGKVFGVSNPRMVRTQMEGQVYLMN